MSKQFRQYTYNDIQTNIKNNYNKMRTNQTVEHVKKIHHLFKNRNKMPMTIMDALHKLNNFIDISDPDVAVPNINHLYQTAEGLRKAGQPDWMQLVGLIHDLGKITYLWNKPELGLSVNEQWSIVGDTFLVGCRLPEGEQQPVYPEFNNNNPDNSNPNYNTPIGMYTANCGLDNCMSAWGHDEYMYQILKETPNNLPEEAYYIIRYHSMYPWHKYGAYQFLENEKDLKMKPYVQIFNDFDLYTKENTNTDITELESYYQQLINKYFPEPIINF
jgi:inositol oxygenase